MAKHWTWLCILNLGLNGISLFFSWWTKLFLRHEFMDILDISYKKTILAYCLVPSLAPTLLPQGLG
jgi:hypothetical protein